MSMTPINDLESFFEGMCHAAEIAGRTVRGKTAQADITREVTTQLLKASVAMRREFDLTIDDKTIQSRRRLSVLTAIHGQLWEEGDLVGAEKTEDLINHLKSEVEFVRDQLARPVFSTFTESL